MAENSFKQSAEFFTERARRISSKVTALSRRDDLSDEEKKELHETISLASVYGQLGVGYGILAILDRLEVVEILEKKDEDSPRSS